MALTSDETRVPSYNSDPWLALFRAARALQANEGWEDYTLPKERANEVIDYLMLTENAPFMVMSGLMPDSIWLWLSPVAESLIFANCPHLLGQPLSVQRRLYRTLKQTTVPGTAQHALHILELDVAAAARERISREIYARV